MDVFNTLAIRVDAKVLEGNIGYLAVGPVFSTDTKATGYEAIGLEIGAKRLPLVRCVVDPSLRVPVGSRLVATAADAPPPGVGSREATMSMKRPSGSSA